MKICHVTSAHPSNDGRIFQKECVSLAKNPENQVFLVAQGESRVEENVQVIGVGKMPSSRLKRMFSFTKKVILTAAKLDADVYHFHDPELLRYAVFFKKKGKKVIFDSHENTVDQIKIKPYIPVALRGIVAKVYYANETRICKKIDGVIFPCPVNGKHPFENRANHITYINNVPILDELCLIDQEKEPGTTACYVGSLTEARGVTQVLKACKIAQVPLILAGPFESEEYEERLKSQGLLENVDYRGVCNRTQVYEIYKEAHIGLATLLNVGQYSKAGNFATKVYEYMSMGLPVVVSDYPYSKEIIEKYNFGVVVDPANPEDIARAITDIVGNKETYKRQSKNGLETVQKYFSWKVEEKSLFDFYDEIYN